MKRTFLILSLAMLSIAGLSLVSSPAAHATNGPQIVNNANNQLVAMNRAGGGTTSGTNVIGWNPGDNNNTFEWLHENDMCGGQVSLSCPTGMPSNWNHIYDQYAIVRIYDYHDNLCVIDGQNAGGYVRTRLGSCNATGHAFVLPGCIGTDFINCADIQFHSPPSIQRTQIDGFSECLMWWFTAIGNQLATSDDCFPDSQDPFQQIQ
jgi:hypothetical protein